MHDTSKLAVWTDEQLSNAATAVAAELKTAAAAAQQSATGPAAGSLHRGLPEKLRLRFIEVRSALFQRGLYDPLLVRFDSATVAQASTAEIAEQLERVAGSLKVVTVSPA